MKYTLLLLFLFSLISNISYAADQQDRLHITALTKEVRSLRLLAKHKEALDRSHKILELSKKLGDYTLIADAYGRIGTICYEMGNFTAFASNTIAALKLAQENKDLTREYKFTINLSAVFLTLQDKAKSLLYARQAYDLSKSLKDSVFIVKAMVNLALSENYNKLYDQQSYHLNEIIRYGTALRDYNYVIGAYLDLACLSFDKNDAQGTYDYFKKANDESIKYNIKDFETNINLGMAEGLHGLKRDREAIVYAKKGLHLAEAANLHKFMSNGYQIISKVYEGLNKSDLAFRYLKKYNQLNDSLTNLQKRSEINRLEMEYNTARKEKALVNQRLSIARSNLEIQKKDKDIIFFVAAIIVLICLIISVYFVYASKNKAQNDKLKAIAKEKEIDLLNAVITGEEKERSRLATNLHDGVGGILSVTKMHLSLLSEQHNELTLCPLFNKALSMLDAASVEARSVAHHLSPHLLAQRGLNKAIAVFCDKVTMPDLEVNYFGIGKIERYTNDFELFIYRTVQEIVNHIIKHAKATQIIVQLSVNHDLLSLTIEDNGTGIDDIGLNNLKSRTLGKGGLFELISSQEEGTSTYLEFEVHSYKTTSDLHPPEEYIVNYE